MAQQRDQGGPAGAGIEPLTTVRVASGLNRPVFATHAPAVAPLLPCLRPGATRLHEQCYAIVGILDLLELLANWGPCP